VKFTSIYIDYEFHAMSNLQPSSSNEVLYMGYAALHAILIKEIQATSWA